MLHLIGFGASTVQGVGDPAGGFLSRAVELSTAVGLPVRWSNFGVGGDTTREMLGRAPQLAELRPYDLVVLLGSNDIPRPGDSEPGRRATVDEYAERIDTLLEMIRGRRSLFISSFVIAALCASPENARFARYMEAVLAAATRHQYEIWDLYAETKDKLASHLWAEDGVHFGDAGHAMIATRVVEWVERGFQTP